MSGWFQNLLKDTAGGFFGSDYLRDYTHANKIFGQNLYQYAPKLKFLFHVYFNINPDVYDIDGSASSRQNFGLLVRDVKLPSYNINTVQMNQYNRKRIVQTKIKYDPVQFSFFDDNGNTLNKMWAAYYTYYYNDGRLPDVNIFAGQARGNKGIDLGSAVKIGQVRGLTNNTVSNPNASKYYERNIYSESITNNVEWGYSGEPVDQNKTKPAFFKDITIFGFYQKNFIAYTLINPLITNFSHDTYDYEQGNGVMKNTMTVDYETVVYNEGKMAGDKSSGGGLVPGFNVDGYYDKLLSPIAQPGSNNTVLGQGGLVDGLSGTLNGLTSGTVGGLIGAVKSAGATYNTFKNTNIVQTLKTELKNSFINNLRQEPNQTRNLNFDFKNPASGPGSATNAGAPAVDSFGGTSNLQNTDRTKGTSFNVVNNSTVVSTGGVNPVSGIPNASPAGKQSNTGGGTQLPNVQNV